LEGERHPGGKKFPCQRDSRAYGTCAPSVRQQRRPARGCPSLPQRRAERLDAQGNRTAGYKRSVDDPSSHVSPLIPLCYTIAPSALGSVSTLALACHILADGDLGSICAPAGALQAMNHPSRVYAVPRRGLWCLVVLSSLCGLLSCTTSPPLAQPPT